MDWQMQGPPHLTPFDTVPRNTSLDALHFPFPTIRSSRILADFPSEMLAEIFFHASSNADEDFDKWDVIIEKLGRDIQCITVSHVCRRWRSIALENPLLWTWIYDKFYTERALEMMRRAKSCPLTVVSRTVSINDAVLEAFPSHLFHLQHLILELDYDTAKSLTSRLVHSAPMLETLRLEVEIGHSGVAYPDLPPNFLASVVPKLQILKLIGVLLPQTSAFYKNLTRFCFAFPEDHSYMYAERCPHPNITIDILHEMPLLEVLELERALPPAGSLLHPHSRRVSFPRLRHIILSGTPQECADLVSCLDFPKATQIRLFSIELGEEDPVDPIISMLQRCYHDLPVPIDELHIDLYNPDELTIEAKTRNSESSYIFSIELFVPEDPDSPLAEAANIARCFITSLPFHNVGKIVYDGDHADEMFSIEDCVQVFETMRLVEEATISGGEATAFIEALGVDVSDYSDSPSPAQHEISQECPSTVFLPGLRELEIRGIDLIDDMVEEDAQISVARMTQILRARKEWGVPLRRLTFNHEYKSEWNFERFMEKVEAVNVLPSIPASSQISMPWAWHG